LLTFPILKLLCTVPKESKKKKQGEQAWEHAREFMGLLCLCWIYTHLWPTRKGKKNHKKQQEEACPGV